MEVVSLLKPKRNAFEGVLIRQVIVLDASQQLSGASPPRTWRKFSGMFMRFSQTNDKTCTDVLLYPEHNDRSTLSAGGSMDFRRLVETSSGIKAAATWLMKTKILKQYAVAEAVLHDN